VEVVIVPDAAAGGELIAEAMAQLLRRKPDALLGVATGSTPLPIYQALTAKVRSGAVDTSRARIAQLDEYVGLPAEHPESYLQVLGIGTDGHIGFNEPCSSLASRTRIKTLTEQTRVDNARFFDGDIGQVPHHVITQGIGTILEARHLVLLATGEGKADAVAATVEGPVAAVCPASALQLHPHATVVVDEAAASKLKLADYFRHTYANKPDWQGI
jgi:glucosamine-6-phosphate deaminase